MFSRASYWGLGFALAIVASGTASGQGRGARAFILSNANCPLEFKSMKQPKAGWKPFKGKLKTGQKAEGFPIGGTDSDVLSFRVPNPKNFFFKGSASCLTQGKEPPSAKTVRTAKVGPKKAKRDEVPDLSESGPSLVETSPQAENHDWKMRFSLQPLFWQETLTFRSTSGSVEESINSTQFGGGLGLVYEKTEGQHAYGGEGQLWGALSSAANVNEASATIAFSATGLMMGLNLRPTYYYYFSTKRNRLGVGPYLSLLTRYAIFAAASDGAIASPLKLTMMTGASARFVSGNDWAIALNLGLVSFGSKFFAGVQVDF